MASRSKLAVAVPPLIVTVVSLATAAQSTTKMELPPVAAIHVSCTEPGTVHALSDELRVTV